MNELGPARCVFPLCSLCLCGDILPFIRGLIRVIRVPFSPSFRMFPESWIADRTRQIELSGIRRVFELGKSLKDPVNLSIGQPHFDVPEPIRAAAKAAIDAGHNGYTVTQGVPELREKLLAEVRGRFPGQDREMLVTSGTSG